MNVYLVEILEKEFFNHFSISQLTDAYLDISEGHNAIEARKFIYKQVLRLLKYKVIYKNGAKNSRNTIYNKTDLFKSITFINKTVSKTLSTQIVNLPKLPSEDKLTLKHQLEKTLQQYKIDMLSAIGESEEYIRLLNSFPEMMSVLSENYRNASDRRSKLLGKIKAINTTLSLRDKLQS